MRTIADEDSARLGLRNLGPAGARLPGARADVVKRVGVAALLLWFPASWRRRYGAELIALLEDTYGSSIPWRCRMDLVRAGSVERLRASGLLGSASAPSDGVLAGSLLVLWAWAGFLAAGAGFANVADNWAASVRGSSARLAAAAGYNVVYCAAIAGGLVVVLAAAICVPAFARFLLAGGWQEIRRRMLQAATVTAVTAGAVTVMSVRAGQLDSSQRNGGLWTYSLLAGVVALLITATIASWTAAGSAAARRLELPARVLRYCGGLALALTIVMTILAAGTAAWWIVIASRAPWFLAGTAPGTAGSLAPAGLAVVGVLMTLALALAVAGARRAAISLRRTARPAPAGRPDQAR
jgi:hypothetical protein